MDKKYYCPLPFNHIFYDSTNQYDVCCHTYSTSDTSQKLRKKYNTNNCLPFDFLFSEDMEEVRTAMKNNVKYPSCEKCYKLDSINFTSPRAKYLKKFGYLTKVDKVEVKVRMFGNYCNLSCYMCHPNHSTGRQRDLLSLGYKLSEFGYSSEDNHRFNNISYNDMEEHILNNLHYIDSLVILGGEPLQVKRFYEFMEKVPDDHASRINVSVGTNLTKLSFKDHNIEDVIKKFRKIAFTISADHIEEKEEWIRWPINFNKFVDNLHELVTIFKRHRNDYYPGMITLTPTISVLNVADLFDIFLYYVTTFDIKVGQTSPQLVDYPRFLQPHLHKDVYKLIDMYKNTHFDDIAEILKQEIKSQEQDMDDYNNLRHRMFEYLDRNSTKRGDWRDLWNQL